MAQTPKPDDEDETVGRITLSEAAALLRRSPAAVFGLITGGTLDGIRVGGRQHGQWLVDRHGVIRLIEAEAKAAKLTKIRAQL